MFHVWVLKSIVYDCQHNNRLLSSFHSRTIPTLCGLAQHRPSNTTINTLLAFRQRLLGMKSNTGLRQESPGEDVLWGTRNRPSLISIKSFDSRPEGCHPHQNCDGVAPMEVHCGGLLALMWFGGGGGGGGGGGVRGAEEAGGGMGTGLMIS